MGKKRVKIDKELRKFLSKLRKKYADIRVYLFGSRARGDWKIYSDYDMLIISDGFKEKKFFERVRELMDLWNKKEALECFPYTKEEFKKLKKRVTFATLFKDAVRLV